MGESPYFHLFGQDRKLPVDFLLGGVAGPMAGTMSDWIVKHQTRLHLALAGARERLATAAGMREKYHAHRVKNVPLQEGQ